MADPIVYANQFVIFGDGSEVQFVSKRTEEVGGRMMWHFLLRPSRDVIFKYRLNTMTDLDPSTGLIIRSYPKSVIHILDDNPNHSRFLVLNDLNNRPTELSRIYERYIEQIMQQEMLNGALRARIARMTEETKLMSSNEDEYSRLIVNRVNRYREVMKRLDNQRDEDDLSSMPFEEGE